MGFPTPSTQASSRVRRLPELPLPLHVCNRWGPGLGVFPVPRAAHHADADSRSWPKTAQATVLLAGAGVLLNTQAERGQIPSVTGLQPTVITTCARGCREATPYYTGK